VIPVASTSTAGKVVVEVRRAAGLMAKRGDLDGFSGTITRLRGAYDAMNETNPISEPPDVLVDAMQTGDRLSYHPETAVEEIARLHEELPKAQAALAEIGKAFEGRVNLFMERQKNHPEHGVAVDYEAEGRVRLAAMTRAQLYLEAAEK